MFEIGLHHVTAFSGPAARNRDFYTRVLGLRLVKTTVNFDDPGTYHLYYGDEAGQPGTLLTFFPIAHAAAGRVGVGETQETAFRVPRASIGWWIHRFVAMNVDHQAPSSAFGEPTLRFRDPDGMRLALVGVEEAGPAPTRDGGDVLAIAAMDDLHRLLGDDRADRVGRGHGLRLGDGCGRGVGDGAAGDEEGERGGDDLGVHDKLRKVWSRPFRAWSQPSASDLNRAGRRRSAKLHSSGSFLRRSLVHRP